jgi:hypothetical protein
MENFVPCSLYIEHLTLCVLDPDELCLQKVMFNAKQTMLNEQVKSKTKALHLCSWCPGALVALLSLTRIFPKQEV